MEVMVISKEKLIELNKEKDIMSNRTGGSLEIRGIEINPKNSDDEEELEEE